MIKSLRSFTNLVLCLLTAFIFMGGKSVNESDDKHDLQDVSAVDASLVASVQSLLDELCGNEEFSGTVLMAKGEEVLLEIACGEASKRFHVPNNMDTKFNLGSMNKMFTATAVMQLVEQGKVKMDDPVSKYVNKSWLPMEITDKITIHHLLSHSGGLGSYFNKTYWNSSRELYRSVDDFKPLVQGSKLEFEPGKKFRYSNTGMLLLGVVIQKATREDYFDYVRQNIYAPAGMNNSDSYEMDQPVENLAIGYVTDKDSEYGWKNNIYKHVIKGGPAGGGFSTARDLHRFALALRNEKLVSQASLDLMWTDHFDEEYGYGFQVRTSEAGKIVGHSGGFPGLSANLDIFLDQGYIIAVMTNHDQSAHSLSAKIREMIIEQNN